MLFYNVLIPLFNINEELYSELETFANTLVRGELEIIHNNTNKILVRGVLDYNEAPIFFKLKEAINNNSLITRLNVKLKEAKLNKEQINKRAN